MRHVRLDSESPRHPLHAQIVTTWSLSDVPWDEDEDDDTDDDEDDDDDDDEEEPEWIVS